MMARRARAIVTPLAMAAGLVLIVSGWLGTIAPVAAQSSAETGAETRTDAQAADTDDNPGENGEDGDGTGSSEAPSGSEVFLPSEEISEDFAVSFPVDI